MKIAYFINHYPKVSHSFIRREIMALELQGFEIQRIALRGWDDPLPDEDDLQEREKTRYVLRYGGWSLLGPTLRALLISPLRFFSALRLAIDMAGESDRPLIYHLAYVAEACRIVPWLNAFGARSVHAHFGTNSTEVAMLARILGGPPYSFTVHGPDEFMRPMGLDEKVRRSSFTVAISSFGRSQLYLRTRYGDWPKVKVVHCGLEPRFFNTTSLPPAISRRFVCVGRLTEAKGQLLLIEAMASLIADGFLCELVLVGDGPMRAALESVIQQHGLGNQIRITGWISSAQVRDELLAARALVLPSFAEGLPVVIMEAMALRRPVLCTYVAGIPELVRPGENGWLFPAGSVEELIRAMQDCLLKSADELMKMGNAGYACAVARHSIGIEAEKLAQLIRAHSESEPGSC